MTDYSLSGFGGGERYIKIGTSDRGTWDMEDNVMLDKSPLATGLTASQAEDFVKKHAGAELIVKYENNVYSVFSVYTSESGKTIQKSDFENGSIDIQDNIAAQLNGKSAFISTSTDYLLKLGPAPFELDFIDDEFITADVNLNIKDLDGIDKDAKKDLKGTIDGKINIDKALISYSLAEASRESGLNFSLDASGGKYMIGVSYGVGLGNVSLTPQNDGTIKANIGGLAGSVAGAADYVVDVGDQVESMLNGLGKDLGFTVSASSATEYLFKPDLKSNALLKNIPIGVKDAKIKIEEINVKPGDLNLKIDQYGNINIGIKKAEVIASSAPGGTLSTQADSKAEGADEINVKLKAEVANDFKTSVETKTDVKMNITPAEQADFKKQIKKYSGQELDFNGKFNLKDIKVDAVINSDGSVKSFSADHGEISMEKLNLKAGGTEINLNSANGIFDPKLEGTKTTISSNDLSLSGKISSGSTKVNIQDLSLSGNLVYDKSDPNKVRLEADKTNGINFTGSVNDGQGKTSINQLKIKDTDIVFDLGANKLSLKPDSANANITAKSITLPYNNSIYGLSMNGSLTADLNNGNVSVDAKNLKIGGTFGDLSLKYLNGSAKVSYVNGQGTTISNANIVASAKIGDFEMKKISGQGDIKIKSDGALEFANTKNLKLETNIGLDVEGNLNAKYNQGVYDIASVGNKPVKINFASDDGTIDLENVKFKGKVSYDQNKNELVFSSYEDQPLEISEGKLMGNDIKNVSLKNGSVKVNLNDGSFEIKSINDGPFVFNADNKDFKIQNLESKGTIKCDFSTQTISWDKETKVSLPKQGVDIFSTTGQNSIKVSGDDIILTGKENKINAKLGNLEVQDLKIDGQIVYNQKNQLISLKGNGDQGFETTGIINGKDLKMHSSGEFTFKDAGENFEVSGKDIKISGAIEGFSLESPKGSSGNFVISKDFSNVSLKDLKLNVNLEGVELSSDNGLIKANENGYEVNLSGNVDLKKEKLFALLDKFSKTDSVSEDVKKSVENALLIMDKNFAKLDSSEIKYDNLALKFDKSFNFQDFDVKANVNLKDTAFNVQLEKNETTVLPVGDVNLGINAHSDSEKFSIKDGQIKFNLNQELRDTMAAYAVEEMQNFGFRDVSLNILPNGDISVENATFVRKKNLLQNEKIKGIKMNIEVDVKVENNQLSVTLDEFKLKNALMQGVNSMVGGKKMISSEVEKALKSGDIDFERNKKKNEFKIDLNSTLKEKLDEGINLKNISISDQGEVTIDYDYLNATETQK